MEKQNTLPSPADARKKAGITQFELSVKSGISLSTISRAERSGKYPRYPNIRAAYLKAVGLK